MHNGAFTSLEAAVRHHSDPVRSFLEYDRSQLFQVELRPTVMNSLSDLREQLASLSFRVLLVPKLSDAEVADLLAFLKALESPSLSRLDTNKPDTVPSGLPVDGTKAPAKK
jgi:cytochrome c peroxidase